MKAGEKGRVTALRLILSELQKAAKEGDGDEVAVLQRERKRRLEAATAYRDGGRDELADARGGRGRADRGLPAGRALRRGAARDRRRRARRDRRHLAARTWARSCGRRWPRSRAAPTASACPRRVKEALRLMRAPARALQRGRRRARGLATTRSCARSRATSTASVFLRGNVLTLDGEAEAVAAAAAVVRELSELVAQGHEIAPGTIEAITGALDAARVARPRSSRTSSGATADQGRAEDGQPEALRRRDPPQHDHLRHRPGRHRQVVPRRRDGRRRAQRAARSTASSSPARPSRPASASASCPAT